MNNETLQSQQIERYQDVATTRSPFSAIRIGRWSAASTKGPQTPVSPGSNISQDHLVIGAIIVGGFGWFFYRRQLARGVKKVEAAV